MSALRRWLSYGLLGSLLLVAAGCAGGSGPAPVPAPPPGAAQPAAAAASAPGAPASAPAPTAPPAPLRMVVNWTAVNGAQGGIWLAYESGLFREHGLEVELTHIASTSRVVQAMVAGEVHLSTLDTAFTMQSSLEGADLVILFGAADRMIFSVLSQPSIQQPAELRGKTVGITRIGSASHTAMLLAFRGWGLAPDRDFALRQLGEASATLAGLQAGQIDAGVISSPTSIVTREAGFRELLNLHTDGPEYPSIVVGGPRAWVNANDEAVRRFGRAYTRAWQRFKQDPAAGRATYQKYFQIESGTVIDDMYAQTSATLTPLPTINEVALTQLLTDLAAQEPRLAGRQITDWLDTRYLRELEAAGYGR